VEGGDAVAVLRVEPVDEEHADGDQRENHDHGHERLHGPHLTIG
jgi:hypothetical protein